MKVSALLATGLATIFLSACGSSYVGSVNTTGAAQNTDELRITLKETSSKIPEVYAQCVYAQLQAHYPSAGFKKKAVNLYQGSVPGIDRNHPRATYEVAGTTDDILAQVVLRQVEPIDHQLLDLFKSCL